MGEWIPIVAPIESPIKVPNIHSPILYQAPGSRTRCLSEPVSQHSRPDTRRSQLQCCMECQLFLDTEGPSVLIAEVLSSDSAWCFCGSVDLYRPEAESRLKGEAHQDRVISFEFSCACFGCFGKMWLSHVACSSVLKSWRNRLTYSKPHKVGNRIKAK